MSYKSIVISSGHSTKCQGAIGIINEVDEATKVVDQVAVGLKTRGVTVKSFHDTVSTSQNANGACSVQADGTACSGVQNDVADMQNG